VIFTVVALLPFLDFALRHVAPDEANQTFRDMSTAIAIVSVLPLLVARIAAEKAELQQAGSTMKLLAQVIEQAQDLILVLTPDGRCRHANSAFCRAMGLSPDELTHLSGRDLMARDGISADDIQSVVRAGGTWRGTMTRTRRDGTTFTSSATVAALLDDRGDPTHIVSVERDISEERRLREQLIHSERLSAVGQLVAGVAHELNNPLQGLMGLTELLISAETRPETRSDLELVRQDGERAAAIVKNLLAFARRSALERSVADLNEIARSSLALRAYELRLAGTAVRTEYADDLPMIVVNREEIQQIVLNLIMNAEHALRAARRPGAISLRTTFDGESVCLEVSDDGLGVPAELVGRIFEPFFTTKGVGEGTGLGLSVSLGIAEAHQGTLALLPSARGARFGLRLPAGAPAQAHQAVMAASKMDASSSAPA
jgi:PAS domain S-box-containing protein